MDAYGHLRMLVSLIVGLAITRTLSGLSRRLQEPYRTPSTAPQIVWSAALLLGVIHFWWWEFALRLIPQWSFWTYIFILSYAALFFLMSTLLYPDHISDHAEREAYFIRRRTAFFALFALSFGFDIVDTLIKGKAHFLSLGGWYLLRCFIGITIALLAMRSRRKRVLVWLGASWLLCNGLWITMLYSELL